MKIYRYIISILCIIIIQSSFAQTTNFHENSITHNNESVRFFSLELFDEGALATIEITALKPLRRLNYWCSTNCYITSGNYKLAQVVGYYINGEIKPCGVDKEWGWDNVPAYDKRYYQLIFKGTIPPGVTNISLVDEGTYQYSGYGSSLAHSYCFNNYTINNPRKYYTSFTNEFDIKHDVDENNDGICGIYEQIGDCQYKLACVKQNGEYILVYMSSNNGFNWWQYGDIKAYLHKSASGIYKGDWFMANKSINKDTYIVFDGLSMTVSQTSGSDIGESKYLKMYPSSSSITNGNTSGEWTGTGFALKNGYIVTNNHVVENAKSIVVQGVNGNSTTEFNAYVVGIDKNNDLALIKINDSRFHGFNAIPYSVKNTNCEVGSNIFVLGYPLTTYMGQEIKLTNGIISSKTGYQGDVSTYQMSAPVQPGNSGGPMFDNNGNIVGVVNAGIPGAENVGYAIKTSYLYNLVNSVASPNIIPNLNNVRQGSLADKVKQVKNFVFFIKCKGK